MGVSFLLRVGLLTIIYDVMHYIIKSRDVIAIDAVEGTITDTQQCSDTKHDNSDLKPRACAAVLYSGSREQCSNCIVVQIENDYETLFYFVCNGACFCGI